MSDHPQETQTWIDRIATLFDRAWKAGEHPGSRSTWPVSQSRDDAKLLEELFRSTRLPSGCRRDAEPRGVCDPLP